MIPAHQAHDSRVMISLHETYNKKTAVTLHLATLDAMYKKMKGSQSCGPSPVHLCKDLDASWSPGVINSLLPDTKLTGPTAAAAT